MVSLLYKCSSVVRAYAHGAMGHGGPTAISCSSQCSMTYPVWDGAYKRTFAANRKMSCPGQRNLTE